MCEVLSFLMSCKRQKWRSYLAEPGEAAFAPEHARLAAGVAESKALSMAWAAGVKLPGS